MRLTFLYPHLFRTIRTSEPAAQTARQCCRQSSSRRAAFATTSRRKQRFVERHGKAVEPFLAPDETKEDTRVFVAEPVPEQVKKDATKKGNKKSGAETDVPREQSGEPGKVDVSATGPLSEETQAAAYIPGDLGSSVKSDPVIQEDQSQSTEAAPARGSPTKDGPLEKIIYAEPPAEEAQDDLHVPHLHPPQYVHNFDSYTLVKEVEKGGFTHEQAVTAMKAVRGLLAKNLDVAKEGLVSKSDVENVSFVIKGTRL
jgi:hypothetical protein